jgi:hypothetical protein
MHRVPLLRGSHDHSRNRMFFLWREAAARAFIGTLTATASQMGACARPAIVLVHMVADVCRRAITLRRRGMGHLLGMGRPPRRRPAAIPDTLHRKILLRRRQEATRLRPDLKRVHLQASEWGTYQASQTRVLCRCRNQSRAPTRRQVWVGAPMASRISRTMSTAWSAKLSNWHWIIEDDHHARRDPVYTFAPIAIVPRRPA